MADVYVKPAKKVILSGVDRHAVMVGDIAEVVAPPDMAGRVLAAHLFKPDLKGKNKQNHVVSITDIVSAIVGAVPGVTVNNIGVADTVVEYVLRPKRDFPLWRGAKAALIAFVLTVGSATAIMSFHSDAQLPDIFRNIYYIFFHERVDNPAIIEIPYAVGVALGITVFYNHIAGKKLTTDPTPIQVEMAAYETEVNDAIIDHLNAEKLNAAQAGKLAKSGKSGKSAKKAEGA